MKNNQFPSQTPKERNETKRFEKFYNYEETATALSVVTRGQILQMC